MANSSCRLDLCILCNIIHTPLLVITVQTFQQYFGPVLVQNKLWKLFTRLLAPVFPVGRPETFIVTLHPFLHVSLLVHVIHRFFVVFWSLGR